MPLVMWDETARLLARNRGLAWLRAHIEDAYPFKRAYQLHRDAPTVTECHGELSLRGITTRNQPPFCRDCGSSWRVNTTAGGYQCKPCYRRGPQPKENDR